MEMIVYLFRHRLADPFDRLQIRQSGAGDGDGAPEMVKQGLLPAGSNPGNLIDHRFPQCLGALRPMGADGEAVRLVPQPLQEIEHGIAHFQLERRAVRHEEALPPGVAVRPLGDADQRHVVDPQIGQHAQRHVELPDAAVDQHQIGPGALRPFRVLLDRPAEAAGHDLAHHREVVAGGALGLDVELAVGVLDEALRPGDDHGADGVGALDVGVVVDLDALRRAVQPEDRRHPVEQPRLRRTFGQPPPMGLPRVGQGVLDDAPLVAPLGRGQFHPVAGAQRQGLGQQFLLRQVVVDQDEAGGRLVLVELRDEGGQHLRSLGTLVVAGEIGAVAVVAPAAEEEHLHAGHSALRVGGDHVGVLDHPFDVDVLVRLHRGQRADTVAVAGGGLVVEILRRLGHLGDELRLDVPAFAGQEGARLIDLRLVLRRADPLHAGRGAALDLVLQAGPGARGEDRVGAVAQQEGALERGDRPVDRPRRGEGTEIVGIARAGAPVLGQLRIIMVLGDHDVREGLVVPQQHVVARHQPLDQVRFEEQRLDLGVGRDELHGLRLRHHALQPHGQAVDLGVIEHPPLQVLGLADIEHGPVARQHAVDPGRLRQGLQMITDHLGPPGEIGGTPAWSRRGGRGALGIRAVGIHAWSVGGHIVVRVRKDEVRGGVCGVGHVSNVVGSWGWVNHPLS
ncbi:protein of unknown function [Azospirillum baldaniorum]|uniref:Uncharacterized protein n=1 Tax=Azospirillum baldaniorum TaxID=1064539 RepID=A0A9P1NMI5_9PROT|nr:protein of unknown function [Azospirillum baldaniorum]